MSEADAADEVGFQPPGTSTSSESPTARTRNPLRSSHDSRGSSQASPRPHHVSQAARSVRLDLPPTHSGSEVHPGAASPSPRQTAPSPTAQSVRHSLQSLRSDMGLAPPAANDATSPKAAKSPRVARSITFDTPLVKQPPSPGGAATPQGPAQSTSVSFQLLPGAQASQGGERSFQGFGKALQAGQAGADATPSSAPTFKLNEQSTGKGSDDEDDLTAFIASKCTWPPYRGPRI